MENHPAKHFVLQLGSLASLYLSLSFLLVLLFGLINLAFTDATDNVYQIESYGNSVRLGIAMVLVFFPTYLTLTRLVNTSRRSGKDSSYLGLTKWLIYLSLLIGGGVLLGDLATVIMTFLEGEITTRFVLKALAVLLVVGAAFYYYLLDAKGYWLKREQRSITFAGITTIFVLLVMAFGLSHIKTPSEVREYKLDQTQISDLQQIQWQLQDYLVVNGTLPMSLESLYQAAGTELPSAPENRPAYTYGTTTDGFELCATFAQASVPDDYMAVPVSGGPGVKGQISNPDNWSHGPGEVCFKRVIAGGDEAARQ